MADKRITQLNELTSVDSNDLLVVVDTSSQETKKVSYSNLLPSGVGSSGLGWARYDDTQYTTGSAFSLTDADGEQILPNNGGRIFNDHIHSTVEFYDSTTKKIQVENENDVYIATVVFKAKTDNANQTYIRLQLDGIDGTPYERVGKDLFFGKGNDVWHEFHEVFQYYGDSDFVTNGNRWNIQSFNADCEIADIILFIQRTQNHGNG